MRGGYVLNVVKVSHHHGGTYNRKKKLRKKKDGELTRQEEVGQSSIIREIAQEGSKIAFWKIELGIILRNTWLELTGNLYNVKVVCAGQGLGN